jgi:2-phosphoglycerate kinase
VRWLGGGSGAGKSTVATRLAAAHGLRVYRTDETLRRHVAAATPDRHPLATAFVAMDMDARWLVRSPAEMVSTFHGFHGELFELIVEDLLALPDATPILAEGFRLLPTLVAPLLIGPQQAAWLIPTSEFRRAAFEARGPAWHGAQATTDPARAMQNLLDRDALFTRRIADEAATLGLTTIPVDGSRSVETLTAQVAAALGIGGDAESARGEARA